MFVNRRTVLSGLGASLLIPAATRAFSSTEITIGEARIYSVSDGNLVLPANFSLGGLPQDEVREVLKQFNLPTDEFRPPCNVTVLRLGDRVVVFDAGSGSSFMPTAGELPDNLDAIGISTDEVTDVIFTHAHPDHIWGVLDDFDDLVFPEATYRIGQAEYDYWSDPETVNSIGEARASFAVGAQRRLEAIEPQMEFIKPGDEVLPGVQAIATFGHTPGHMSFEVRSGTNALLIGGDAITNHHVAFARPEWQSGSDQDAERGVETRVRLLDQLASDDIMLLGFHLPNGGLGRVERDGTAYRFVPEDTE